MPWEINSRTVSWTRMVGKTPGFLLFRTHTAEGKAYRRLRLMGTSGAIKRGESSYHWQQCWRPEPEGY